MIMWPLCVRVCVVYVHVCVVCVCVCVCCVCVCAHMQIMINCLSL